MHTIAFPRSCFIQLTLETIVLTKFPIVKEIGLFAIFMNSLRKFFANFNQKLLKLYQNNQMKLFLFFLFKHCSKVISRIQSSKTVETLNHYR